MLRNIAPVFLMLGMSSMAVGPTISEPAAPLTAVVSLSNKQVILGEPIIVKYDIVNHGEKDVTVDLNDGRNPWEWSTKSWFSIQAFNKTGRTCDTKLPVAHFYNGAYTTSKRITAGDSLSDSLVANSQIVIQNPGIYDIVFHVQLPYTMDRNGQWHSLTQDYHLSLTVTAADRAHLTTAANSLYRDYFKEGNNQKKGKLLQCLFSLPQAEALPFWSALVVRPDFTETEFVAEYLASQKSLESASLLASMSVSHSDPAPVLRRLIDVYRHSDAKVQQAIDKVYQDYGRALPPSPPLRLD